MYVIQDVNPTGDQWRVLKNDQTVFTGGFKSLLRYTVHELNFDIGEFEKTIPAITNMGHNTLKFNSAKRVVSTEYIPIQNKKAG